MPRLLILATTIVTLCLGGASALQQEAVEAYQFGHSSLNSLSNQVTGGLLDLHNTLPGSDAGS